MCFACTQEIGQFACINEFCLDSERMKLACIQYISLADVSGSFSFFQSVSLSVCIIHSWRSSTGIHILWAGEHVIKKKIMRPKHIQQIKGVQKSTIFRPLTYCRKDEVIASVAVKSYSLCVCTKLTAYTFHWDVYVRLCVCERVVIIVIMMMIFFFTTFEESNASRCSLVTGTFFVCILA